MSTATARQVVAPIPSTRITQDEVLERFTTASDPEIEAALKAARKGSRRPAGDFPKVDPLPTTADFADAVDALAIAQREIEAIEPRVSAAKYRLRSALGLMRLKALRAGTGFLSSMYAEGTLAASGGDEKSLVEVCLTWAKKYADLKADRSALEPLVKALGAKTFARFFRPEIKIAARYTVSEDEGELAKLLAVLDPRSRREVPAEFQGKTAAEVFAHFFVAARVIKVTDAGHREAHTLDDKALAAFEKATRPAAASVKLT